MTQSDSLLEAAAKWHGGVLALLLLFFGVCALLALGLLITGRDNSVKLLLIGSFGAFASGKALARKYAKKLVRGRAEHDEIDS
jgi:hypothetical protein